MSKVIHMRPPEAAHDKEGAAPSGPSFVANTGTHHAQFNSTAPINQAEESNVFGKTLRPIPKAFQALAMERRWFPVREEPHEGGGKPAKVPVDYRTGYRADFNDPNIHRTLEEARQYQQTHDLVGVGTATNCIDLDNCYDPSTGETAAWAQEILEAAGDAVVERSHSERGFHIFLADPIGPKVNCKPADLDLLGAGSYTMVTFNMLDGCPDEIGPAPEALARSRARIAQFRQAKPAKTTAPLARHSDLITPRMLNTYALENLSGWVPYVGWDAEPSGEGYRVHDYNRRDLPGVAMAALEEVLSIHPTGAKDFAVHDMGDPKEGRRSPIDLLMEHERIGYREAVQMLAELLGYRMDEIDLGDKPKTDPAMFLDKAAQATAPANEATARKRFLTEADLMGRPPMRYLLERYLPQVGVGFLWAQPEAGKSLVVLAWLFLIGRGRKSWQGRAIDAPDNAMAFYVTGEGSTGLDNRLAALRQQYGAPDGEESRLRVQETATGMLDTEEVGALIAGIREEAQGRPIAAVCIDTLSRSLVGGDENSAQTMSMFVAACDRIRDAFQCAVIVVHHALKDGSSMRGSSALRGAADFEFELVRERGAEVGSVFCRKMKDGAGHWAEHFSFREVALGDGQSSMRVDRTDAPAAGSKGQAGLPEMLLVAVVDELSGETGSAPQAAVSALFCDRYGKAKGATAKAARTAYTRAVKEHGPTGPVDARRLAELVVDGLKHWAPVEWKAAERWCEAADAQGAEA